MRLPSWRAAPALAALLLSISVVQGSAANLSLTSQNFTPYRTCTITATPATTTAVIDTTVRQGTATTNFGALTTLTVSSGAGINQRIYVKFDLTTCVPTIPSTAIVRLATLRIYVTVLPAACRTVDIFKVTAAWTEAAITWNNQPFGATINNPASGTRSGTFNVGTPVGCQNLAVGYVTGTLTSDVATFVAGTSTNFGWMLRDDVEGSATTRTSTYSAKELGTVAQEPQLVVTYVTVP